MEEYRDHKSELYGPQMRFGEHPKRRHEVINVQSKFLTRIKGKTINHKCLKIKNYHQFIHNRNNARRRKKSEL